MSTVAYEIVDVFTDRPFTGNPLAVVFGGEELTGGQMQAMAREFNLSETVFLLPVTSPGATYRARIFTPGAELPFAGHPSVGAAVTGMRHGLFPAGRLVQECGAGLLPVVVEQPGSATLTGGGPTLSDRLDVPPLLELAGLTAADHDGPAPRRAGCGLEFVYLPVGPDALPRAAVDPSAAAKLGVPTLSVFVWSPGTATADARVFCPGLGVVEDPAAGSAALGLGVFLTVSGLLPADGTSSFTVHQGAAMGRPSVLRCTVTAGSGSVTETTVGGSVVPVARGEMTVPPISG